MPDPHDPRPAPGGRGATVLWVAAVLLALGATAVMVLSDDVQILRLGLVGALWSALVAALAVTKLRQRLSEKSDREADLQRIYELELEREIAARREFEAEAESDARRRAAEESGDDLAKLRSELANLRTALEQIVGGDVLVERVALRAESTRVRSWGEHGGNSHVIQSADARGRPLPSGRQDNGTYVEYGHSDYAQNGHAEFASRSGDGGYRADHGQGAQAYQHGTEQSGHATAPRPDRQGTRGANGAARAAQNGRRPAPSGRSDQHANQQEPPAARTDLIARMNGDEPRPQQTSSPARHPAPARPGSGHGDPMRDSARPAVIRRDQHAAGASRRPRADPPAAESASGHTGEWPVAQGDLSEPAAPTRAAQPATPEPAPQDPAEAKRSGRPVPGAHAEGTSVTELLAAFGGKGTSARRRRREE